MKCWEWEELNFFLILEEPFRPVWPVASEAPSLPHCQATGLDRMHRCIDKRKCIEDGFWKVFDSADVEFSNRLYPSEPEKRTKNRSIGNWEINDEWPVTERSTGYLLFTSVVFRATNKHRLHSDRRCSNFNAFPLIFLSSLKIRTSKNETESICFIIASQSSQALLQCSITHPPSSDERTIEQGAPTTVQCPQHPHPQRWWSGGMHRSLSPPSLTQPCF